MRTLRLFVIFVLFFASGTALWGRAVLIAKAHSNPWGMMPLSLLAYSPFHSWLIPGMILLVSNGLLALWVLSVARRRGQRHSGKSISEVSFARISGTCGSRAAGKAKRTEFIRKTYSSGGNFLLSRREKLPLREFSRRGNEN